MIVDLAFHPIGTSVSLIEKSPDFGDSKDFHYELN